MTAPRDDIRVAVEDFLSEIRRISIDKGPDTVPFEIKKAGGAMLEWAQGMGLVDAKCAQCSRSVLRPHDWTPNDAPIFCRCGAAFWRLPEEGQS